MDDLLEKRTYASRLYDFYGVLLTKKQQEIFEYYYHSDYSLGEIAEDLTTSRQAVFDSVKRSERALDEYEEKLGLLAKSQERTALIARLTKRLQAAEQAGQMPDAAALVRELEALV